GTAHLAPPGPFDTWDTKFDVVLPADGTYILAIIGNPFRPAPIAYRFSVTAALTNSFPLTLGATVNGNIAVADQRDVYTFTGTPDQTLFFDALTAFTTSRSIGWTLTGPGGQVVIHG